MATTNFFDAFTYKWAQSGSVYNWDDAQYKLGWATIGAVPPSVEQFNRIQQLQDEKANYLFSQLQTAATAKGITLTAVDMLGLKKLLDAYTPLATSATAGLIKSSTLAQAQGLSDAGTAITPYTLGAMFNKRADGPNDYIRIPDVPGGTLIQWGKVQNDGHKPFPIAFPTVCHVITLGATMGDNYWLFSPTIRSHDRFGFNFANRSWGGETIQTAGEYSYYIAIGK